MINTIVNVDVRSLDLDYVTIDHAIEQLIEIRNSIPENYQSITRIEHGYTDEGIEWSACYFRKKTEQEFANESLLKKKQLHKRRDELAKQLKQAE